MPTSSQQHDMPYYRHFLYPKNREKSAGFWLSVQKRPVSRADEGIRPYGICHSLSFVKYALSYPFSE